MVDNAEETKTKSSKQAVCSLDWIGVHGVSKWVKQADTIQDKLNTYLNRSSFIDSVRCSICIGPQIEPAVTIAGT